MTKKHHGSKRYVTMSPVLHPEECCFIRWIHPIKKAQISIGPLTFFFFATFPQTQVGNFFLRCINGCRTRLLAKNLLVEMAISQMAYNSRSIEKVEGTT